MNEAVNPYSAPRSNVRLPNSPINANELLPEPRSLSARDGLQWVTAGWSLIKKDLGIWVLMILAWIVINIVLSLVPFVGSLASSLLSSVFFGGFLIAARAGDQGERVDFMSLFVGFKENFAPLLGLGAISFGLGIVGGLLVGVGMWAALMTGSFTDPNQLFSSPIFWGLALFGTVYFTWVMMLLAFATPLVALNNVPVFKSLALSQKACIYNIIPLLVFSIVAFLIVMLGMIALIIGLLLALPVLTGAYYKAYQQIFLK